MSTDAVTMWLSTAGRQPLLTAAEEIHLSQMVQEWLNHPDGRDGAPRGVQRRGLRARDRMVKANLRMVATVCRKFTKRLRGSAGLSFEDLLQEGTIGLQRAAEKFDPQRGFKFSTYAYWWIQQGVTRAIELHLSAIRISTNALATARRWRYRDQGVTLEQFAEQEGIPVERARQVLARVAAADGPISLDRPARGTLDNACDLVDLIAADIEDPLSNFDFELAVATLEAALPDDVALVEQQAVMGRRQCEIGEELGIRPSRVKSRICEAKQRLRVVGEAAMQELVA